MSKAKSATNSPRRKKAVKASLVPTAPSVKELERDVMSLPLPVTIDSPEAFNNGRDIYRNIKLLGKRIEESRDRIIAPLKLSIAETKSLFQPLLDKVNARAAELNASLAQYANELERIRVEEQARIENDRRLKNPETIARHLANIEERPAGTMTVRELVILDPEQIPDEFWILDEVAIRKALLAGEVVPGATLKDKLVVTSR